MKKMMRILFYVVCLTGVAYAANNASLADIGQGAESEIISFIKSFKWIFAIAGLAVPLGAAGWTYNKIADQESMDSNGQSQPKFFKWFKIFGAFLAGLVIMYLLYGGAAVMFLSKNFSEGWGVFVSSFFQEIFN